jgi:hypothetical protein
MRIPALSHLLPARYAWRLIELDESLGARNGQKRMSNFPHRSVWAHSAVYGLLQEVQSSLVARDASTRVVMSARYCGRPRNERQNTEEQ